jgi:bifunctional DNase/RNase
VRACSVVLSLLVAAGAAAAPVEVEVRGMRVDAETGSPVVRLAEKAKGAEARELPIWIGPFEAQAIALEMHGVPSPRPLTHDLMKQLVERLGARLDRVVIDDLRDNTYFATLYLDSPSGRTLTVDARPSDAIALALRLRGTIMVAEELFARAAAAPTPAAARRWGLTLQDLTPDMAGFFDVPARGGVLVSDVAKTAAAREVERGDVITAVDDQPVASVAELTRHADAHDVETPVRLSLYRSGKRLELSFAGR